MKMNEGIEEKISKYPFLMVAVVSHNHYTLMSHVKNTFFYLLIQEYELSELERTDTFL